MSFLEDELNDSGGFLETEDDSRVQQIDTEEIPRPPHPYSASNEDVKENYWHERYHDCTESMVWEKGMKTGECPNCNRGFCIPQKQRNHQCHDCGDYIIDFDWDDPRLNEKWD